MVYGVLFSTTIGAMGWLPPLATFGVDVDGVEPDSLRRRVVISVNSSLIPSADLAETYL
jgi:hypothetical protein